MGVRATQDLVRAIVKTYTVKTGGATTAGKPVKFGTTDTEVDTLLAADANIGFGVALETKAAGLPVQVAPFGVQIVPMIVGTGGATRGLKLKIASDNTGVTDTGATTDVFVGRAMQSGVVGDLIGVLTGGGL